MLETNNTNNKVRVRFAPSPTGYLHIGSLRVALFNWLFARHNHGTFLVRIEDTDPERSTKEYEDSILESLDWVNIKSDELIIYQSKRAEIYKKLADQLLKTGQAYKCYCSAEELETRLKVQNNSNNTNNISFDYKKYDQKCRNLTAQDQEDQENKKFTVRFKLPDTFEGSDKIVFQDLIRDKVSFNLDQLDDFIILRSDGTPTYNFVVVIDDFDMKITHVLRGEDHISNTPKQILLYKACNFSLPKFAHLPLVLGPDGSKLSKRHCSTAVDNYKKEGFLAEALCNYLVRLGWSHEDQEIFTRTELIKYFSLDQITKKGAIFDIKKLEWVNGVYIKSSSAQDLVNFIEKDTDHNFKNYFKDWDYATLLKLVDLYKERVKTLTELITELKDLYQVSNIQNLDYKKLLSQNLDHNLEQNLNYIIELLQQENNFSADNLSKKIKNLLKTLNIKLPAVAMPIRVALTGKSSSPGIFELLSILNKSESINRLNNFKKLLNIQKI